jgi:predicted AlkP superfamily pyrophosphatase or phosphodiesterase
MIRKLSVCVLLVLLLSAGACAQTTRPIAQIDRAMVISVDGMRPDLLLRAKAPVMHGLYRKGSFTFWARTIEIGITLPSHVSMMTGVSPEIHGVTWNHGRNVGQGVYSDAPTLFEDAKKAGYTTAMAAGKPKFDALAKPRTLDWQYIVENKNDDGGDVADAAVGFIKGHRPQVMLVHFPDPDWAGHRYGWGSDEQIKSIEQVDEYVGRVLAAMDERKVTSSTLIILTADHGGQGKVHGKNDARSLHIPWIATGPGIRQNYDLTLDRTLQVDTVDTFATVCWVLAIANGRDVEGKPITQIAQSSAPTTAQTDDD